MWRALVSAASKPCACTWGHHEERGVSATLLIEFGCVIGLHRRPVSSTIFVRDLVMCRACTGCCNRVNVCENLVKVKVLKKDKHCVERGGKRC